MRLLAACPECQLQYWSDETETSQSVHCYCGALIPLQASTGKDARVVRCSACGAGREKNAPACGFCAADFTVHEKDLNTICPDCMTRISDRARYCHYCGLAIKPRFSTGKRSELNCPACAGSKPLYVRKEEGLSPFLECHVCAGVWLSLEDFSEICRRAKSDTIPKLLQKQKPQIRVSDLSKEAGTPNPSFYRRCPADRNPMNRRNVAGKSGVIVDYCAEHGVWFDGNELGALIDWIRQGGLNQAQAELLLKAGKKPANSRNSRIEPPPARPHQDSLWEDIFDLVFG